MLFVRLHGRTHSGLDPESSLHLPDSITPENDWLLAASEAAYGLRLKSLDFHATIAEVFEDLEA